MDAKDLTAHSPAVTSRKLMIFVLVLSLSGLANLIAELLPELRIGMIEVGISNFYFVVLSLAILFKSWWAAFAAPVGEIVFSDLLLGEFGGLSEFEEVFLTAFGLYLASRLVRNPRSAWQVLAAGLVGFGVAEMAATFIDILKVMIGVEELEAVEGLSRSIFVLEGIDFGVEFLISGLLLGALPAMTLVPQLHGKLEPLMGLEPRKADQPVDHKADVVLALTGVIFVALAAGIAVAAEAGFNILAWEPEFLDTVGSWFVYVPIVVAILVAAAVLTLRIAKGRQRA